MSASVMGQLGNATRIATVGLHGHRRQRRLHLPGLQQHRIVAGGNRPCIEPL